jgi:hypothetical protein
LPPLPVFDAQGAPGLLPTTIVSTNVCRVRPQIAMEERKPP